MNYDDFKRFCSQDETRELLMEPFLYHGIGIDARMLVNEAPVKNIEDVMVNHWMGEPRDFTGITLPKAMPLERCPSCDLYKCCEPKGQPTEDDALGLPKVCNCQGCEGTGWKDNRGNPVILMGLPFNSMFLRKIATLAGLKFGLGWAPPDKHTRMNLKLGFTFDEGGEGALMAMRWNNYFTPEGMTNLTPEIKPISY